MLILFFNAIAQAYENHYPLILSPDIIWLQISSNLANHINQDPEKYRKLFVGHEGKKEIIVIRNDFVKGNPHNPWPEVFGTFSNCIKGYIGDELHSTIVSNFSTTTPITKAVSEIVLMDTCQNYFEYRLMTKCGIPSINLQGTLEDWINIRERVDRLRQFDLNWWIDCLAPVMDQFVEAHKGNIDNSFWSNIFKVSGGSGGPYVNGWNIVFFPYLKNGYKNESMPSWNAPKRFGGISPGKVTWGFNKAPFKWEYYDKVFDMNLLGGFIGVSQDPNTKALKPEIGWLVGERDTNTTKSN